MSGEEEPLLFDRGQFAMVGLSLFDNPRVIESDPVIGGGIIRLPARPPPGRGQLNHPATTRATAP